MADDDAQADAWEILYAKVREVLRQYGEKTIWVAQTITC